jgi:hypothetical protein
MLRNVPADDLIYLDDADKKRMFAAAYRATKRAHSDAWDAANLVFPGDESWGRFRLYAREHWPDDPVVVAEMARLDALPPPEPELPSLAYTLKSILDIANNAEIDIEARLKAWKLYCEGMQYIGKTTVQVNNNSTTRVVNNVMVVPALAPDWEQRMAAQQKKLIADARSTTH